MEKWKKTLEAYTFTGMNGLILTSFYGISPSDGEEDFGLELENVKDEMLSGANYNPSTDTLEDLKQPKELLKYRAIIIESEGLPEDTKKWLVRLLRKIEELK